MIAAIGAVASNGMLGLDGWLPWDIPEELAYFEETVAGAALVIGRLTYESMDVVPPDSFVVSTQPGLALRPGCIQVDSVEKGLLTATATGKDVFVIGGASIYAAAWLYCQRFYLTRIGMPFAGDTLFPESIPLERWTVISDVRKTYRERKSGREVECRFLHTSSPTRSSFLWAIRRQQVEQRIETAEVDRDIGPGMDGRPGAISPKSESLQLRSTKAQCSFSASMRGISAANSGVRRASFSRTICGGRGTTALAPVAAIRRSSRKVGTAPPWTMRSISR